MGTKAQTITIPIKAAGIAQMEKQIDNLAKKFKGVSLSEEDLKRIESMQQELDQIKETMNDLEIGNVKTDQFEKAMQLIDENFSAITNDINLMKSSITELGQNTGIDSVISQMEQLSSTVNGARLSIHNMYDEIIASNEALKKQGPVERKDIAPPKEEMSEWRKKAQAEWLARNTRSKEKIEEDNAREAQSTANHHTDYKFTQLSMADDTEGLKAYKKELKQTQKELKKKNKAEEELRKGSEKTEEPVKTEINQTNQRTTATNKLNESIKETNEELEKEREELEKIKKAYEDVYDAKKKVLTVSEYELEDKDGDLALAKNFEASRKRREDAEERVLKSALDDLNEAITDYDELFSKKVSGKAEIAKRQAQLLDQAKYIESIMNVTSSFSNRFELLEGFPIDKVNVIINNIDTLQDAVVSGSNNIIEAEQALEQGDIETAKSIKKKIAVNKKLIEYKTEVEDEGKEPVAEDGQVIDKIQKIRLRVTNKEVKKLIERVDKIIDNLNENVDPLKIPVAFVSKVKKDQVEEIVQQMLDKGIMNLDGKTDEEVKALVEGLRKDLNKALKSRDAKLEIKDNVDELKNRLKEGIKDITSIVGGPDIYANIKIDREKVETELKKLKKFKLEIDDIKFGKGILQSLTTAEELLEKQKQTGEEITEENEKAVIEKAEKETKKIEKLVQDAFKVTELIKKLNELVGVIPLSVDVQFNEKQIKADLEAIEGLAVKVSKLIFDGATPLVASKVEVDETSETTGKKGKKKKNKKDSSEEDKTSDIDFVVNGDTKNGVTFKSDGKDINTDNVNIKDNGDIEIAANEVINIGTNEVINIGTNGTININGGTITGGTISGGTFTGGTFTGTFEGGSTPPPSSPNTPNDNKPKEPPTDKKDNKNIEKSVEKGAEKGTEKGSTKGTEKGSQKGSEKGTEKGSEKGAKKGAEEGTKKANKETPKKTPEEKPEHIKQAEENYKNSSLRKRVDAIEADPNHHTTDEGIIKILRNEENQLQEKLEPGFMAALIDAYKTEEVRKETDTFLSGMSELFKNIEMSNGEIVQTKENLEKVDEFLKEFIKQGGNTNPEFVRQELATLVKEGKASKNILSYAGGKSLLSFISRDYLHPEISAQDTGMLEDRLRDIMDTKRGFNVKESYKKIEWTKKGLSVRPENLENTLDFIDDIINYGINQSNETILSALINKISPRNRNIIETLTKAGYPEYSNLRELRGETYSDKNFGARYKKTQRTIAREKERNTPVSVTKISKETVVSPLEQVLDLLHKLDVTYSRLGMQTEQYLEDAKILEKMAGDEEHASAQEKADKIGKTKSPSQKKAKINKFTNRLIQNPNYGKYKAAEKSRKILEDQIYNEILALSDLDFNSLINSTDFNSSTNGFKAFTNRKVSKEQLTADRKKIVDRQFKEKTEELERSFAELISVRDDGTDVNKLSEEENALRNETIAALEEQYNNAIENLVELIFKYKPDIKLKGKADESTFKSFAKEWGITSEVLNDVKESFKEEKENIKAQEFANKGGFTAEQMAGIAETLKTLLESGQDYESALETLLGEMEIAKAEAKVDVTNKAVDLSDRIFYLNQARIKPKGKTEKDKLKMDVKKLTPEEKAQRKELYDKYNEEFLKPIRDTFDTVIKETPTLSKESIEFKSSDDQIAYFESKLYAIDQLFQKIDAYKDKYKEDTDKEKTIVELLNDAFGFGSNVESNRYSDINRFTDYVSTYSEDLAKLEELKAKKDEKTKKVQEEADTTNWLTLTDSQAKDINEIINKLKLNEEGSIAENKANKQIIKELMDKLTSIAYGKNKKKPKGIIPFDELERVINLNKVEEEYSSTAGNRETLRRTREAYEKEVWKANQKLLRMSDKDKDTEEYKDAVFKRDLYKDLLTKNDQQFSETISKRKDAYENFFESLKTFVLPKSEEVGQDIDKGEAEGLKKNAPKVNEAMADVQQGVIKTAKDEVDSNSPSVVFFRIGEDVIQGYLNGIKSGKEKAEKEVRQAVEEINSILKEAHEEEGIYFTDTYGNPVWIYRGVRNSAGAKSSLEYAGVYGNTNPRVAASYNGENIINGRIYAYNVKPKNPLEVNARGRSWGDVPYSFDEIIGDTKDSFVESLMQVYYGVIPKLTARDLKETDVKRFDEIYKRMQTQLADSTVDNLPEIYKNFSDLALRIADKYFEKEDSKANITSKLNESNKAFNDFSETARLDVRGKLPLIGNFTTDEIIEIASELGYDLVAVRNVIDGLGIVSDDIIALDKSIIKNMKVGSVAPFADDADLKNVIRTYILSEAANAINYDENGNIKRIDHFDGVNDDGTTSRQLISFYNGLSKELRESFKEIATSAKLVEGLDLKPIKNLDELRDAGDLNSDALGELLNKQTSFIQLFHEEAKKSLLYESAVVEDVKEEANADKIEINSAETKIESKETNVEGEKVVAAQETKAWKEYNEEVALGLERLERIRKIKAFGITNSRDLYKFASMRQDLFDELTDEDFKYVKENPGVVSNYISNKVDKMFSDDALMKFREQLDEIAKIKSAGFGLNSESYWWTHFNTVDEKGNRTDNFKNGPIYKMYATFEDLANLNKDIVSKIMQELSAAGFKGQLKIPSFNNFDRAGSSDQLVIHGANVDMQKIAYEVLTKKFGNIFSFVSGGFDSMGKHHASFSQILSGQGEGFKIGTEETFKTVAELFRKETGKVDNVTINTNVANVDSDKTNVESELPTAAAGGGTPPTPPRVPNWWIEQAKENYKKDALKVEAIKNDPEAHFTPKEIAGLYLAGDYRAVERIKAAQERGKETEKIINDIKNSPDLHTTDAKMVELLRAGDYEGAKAYKENQNKPEYIKQAEENYKKGKAKVDKIKNDTNRHTTSKEMMDLIRSGAFDKNKDLEDFINNEIDKKKNTEIWKRQAGNLKLVDKVAKAYEFSEFSKLEDGLEKFADVYELSEENRNTLRERVERLESLLNKNTNVVNNGGGGGNGAPPSFMGRYWYLNYANDKAARDKNYEDLVNEDIDTYLNEKVGADIGNLEGFRQFEKEYLDYLNFMLEAADKDEKTFYKGWIKFTKENLAERRKVLEDEEAERRRISEEEKKLLDNREKEHSSQMAQAEKTVKAEEELRRKKEEAEQKANEQEFKNQMAQAEKTVKDEEAKKQKILTALQGIIDKEDKKGNAYFTKSIRERAKGYIRVINNDELYNEREINGFIGYSKGGGASNPKWVTQDKGSLKKQKNELIKLLNNENLVGDDRIPVEDLLKKIKDIFDATYGELSKEAYNKIIEEYEEITSKAKEAVKEQKNLNKVTSDLSEELDTIVNKKTSKENRDFYSPEIREQADYYLKNLDVSDLSQVQKFIKDTTQNSSENISGELDTLKDLLTKAQKLYSDEKIGDTLKLNIKGFINETEELSKQSFISEKAVTELSMAFKDLEREASKVKGNFFTEIGTQLSHLNAKFLAQYMSLHDIIRYIRNIISTITELDTALTEMRKVSDETISSLKEYQKTTFDTASALGTTAIQLQQSTADWMRLGESMKEAAKSAQAATILMNVSEFESIKDATTALTAMSQAYKDLDKTEIIDVMNNIGNNYAIATDELATALQSSAGALMTQGNDLYKAAALVTAGNQVLQDANKTGTGIRTIALRIAGVKEGEDDSVKEELEELGEEVDDWVVSTTAKKRKIIMDYTKVAANEGKGVDILDPNGNLKDTYTILLEISKIYKQIQEEDKKFGTNRASALVEELAGKNRSTIAASILLNGDILEDVYNSAMNSAGSAAEENAKYLDSIAGKIQQLKNEFQELQYNLVDSEAIKDLVDIAKLALNIVNLLTKKIPNLTTVIIALGAAILAMSKNIFVSNTEMTIFQKGIYTVTEFIKKLRVAQDAATVATEAGTAAIEAQTKANIAATVASKAKNAVIAVAVTAVIAVLSKLIKKIVTYREEVEKAATESRSKVREIQNDLQNSTKTIDEVGKKYAEMAQKVGNLGSINQNQGALSNEEYNEFLDISDQLSELFPSLTKEYNENGRAILSLSGDVEQIVGTLNEYLEIRKDIAAEEMFENAGNIYKDDRAKYLNAIKKNKNSKSEYERQQEIYEKILNNVGTEDLDYNDVVEVFNKTFGNSGMWSQNPIDKVVYDKIKNNQGAVGYGYDFSKLSEDEIKALKIQQEKTRKEYKKEVNKTDEIVRQVNSDFRQNIMTYMVFTDIDENNQSIIESMLDSFDFGNIPKTIKSWEGATEWFEENYVQAIENIDDEIIKEEMANVLNDATLSSTKKIDIIQNIINSLMDSTENGGQGLSPDNPLIIYWDSMYKGEIDKRNEGITKIALGMGYDETDAWGRREAAKLFDKLTPAEIETLMNDISLDPGTIEGWEDLSNAIHKIELDATKFKNAGALLSQDTFIKEADNNMYKTLEEQYKDALERMEYVRAESIKKQMDEFAEGAVSWQDVNEELTDLYRSGKLDEDTLKKYEHWDLIMKELGKDTSEADDFAKEFLQTIEKMSKDGIDNLDEFKQGMSHLDSAFQQYKKGKLIDPAMLSDIRSVFGETGEAYDNFEKAVMSGQKNLQPYFNDLINAYAEQKLTFEGLNEETREWYEQVLVASGVTKKSAHDTVESILREKAAIEGSAKSALTDMNNAVRNAGDAYKGYIVSKEDVNDLTAKEVLNLIKVNQAIKENKQLTEEQVDELGVEEIALDSAAQAIVFFALKKELSKDNSMRNEDDIAYLMQLIQLAGIAGSEVARMQNILNNYAQYETEIASAQERMNKILNGKSVTQLTDGEYSAYQAIYNDYMYYLGLVNEANDWTQEMWDKIKDEYGFNMDDLIYGGDPDSSKSTAEEMYQKFKELLEKLLALYDAELAAGTITVQEYVEKSRRLIEEYYNDGKIKAADYYGYLESLAEKEKNQYDKVISAVQKLIQKQIKDLEKQKETIEESYNKQIEAIQEKIDAIQDENEEIDKNMALQKAQYNLNRALNQKTKLMYSESRGFYYTVDTKGVQDAEEELRKAQQDKLIYEYQKEIERLQEEMKKATEAIDEQIKKLNEYSEAWGEVASQLEDSMNAQIAAQILGQDWEEKILNQRLDTLQTFTDKYIDLQKQQIEWARLRAQAELDAQLLTGIGGVNAPSGPSSNPPGSTPYTYEYNGNGSYKTEADAKKQQEKDAQDEYDKTYNHHISQINDAMPEWAKEKQRELAKRKAEEAKSDWILNHPIKPIFAHYNGTSSAKRGESLVGEFGSEIVLHKNGTASIVDSPTLMDMEGGEKVFNAKETEDILKSKYKPLKNVNPKKFALLHSFANGTSSAMQNMVAAQAVSIASGLKNGLVPALATTGGNQTINQTFNVSLPNITDSSKAQDLFKEFEQLQRKATQFFN